MFSANKWGREDAKEHSYHHHQSFHWGMASIVLLKICAKCFAMPLLASVWYASGAMVMLPRGTTRWYIAITTKTWLNQYLWRKHLYATCPDIYIKFKYFINDRIWNVYIANIIWKYKWIWTKTDKNDNYDIVSYRLYCIRTIFYNIKIPNNIFSISKIFSLLYGQMELGPFSAKWNEFLFICIFPNQLWEHFSLLIWIEIATSCTRSKTGYPWAK